MTTISDSSTAGREPALLGQTVLIVGGSSGAGLETPRLAPSEGADVVLTARDPERLRRAATDVGARPTNPAATRGPAGRHVPLLHG